MTREERKQAARETVATIIAGVAVGVVVGALVPMLDVETIKTACAVVGAGTVAYGVVRLVVWIGGDR